MSFFWSFMVLSTVLTVDAAYADSRPLSSLAMRTASVPAGVPMVNSNTDQDLSLLDEPPEVDILESSYPVDDTKLMITPGTPFYTSWPQLSLRAGYAGYGADYKHGGGLGVVAFIEGGRIGMITQTNVVAGQDSLFAYWEGDVRARVRFPIDRDHVWWWGGGADVGWQLASSTALRSHFKAGATAVFGYMRPIESKGQIECVIHFFGKASLDVYNDQSASDWHWLRPAVGAEGFAQCGTLRVLGEYRHVFGGGRWHGVVADGLTDDVDQVSAQVSKTWRLQGRKWQVGVFGKGEITYERDSDALEGNSVPGLFGGVEVRY